MGIRIALKHYENTQPVTGRSRAPRWRAGSWNFFYSSALFRVLYFFFASCTAMHVSLSYQLVLLCLMVCFWWRGSEAQVAWVSFVPVVQGTSFWRPKSLHRVATVNLFAACRAEHLVPAQHRAQLCSVIPKHCGNKGYGNVFYIQKEIRDGRISLLSRVQIKGVFDQTLAC
jgi:hypothetical protein